MNISHSHILVWLVFIAAGCSGSEPERSVPSRLANDPCSASVDEVTCLAGGTCQWISLDAPCMDGESCISGVCMSPDPCRAFGDESSCISGGCAWAGMELLCPADAACDEGFCYTPGDDGCVCACPAYCEPGEECPPCTCDCSGGGGTCTCDSPTCEPGEMCPPSTCDCSDTGCSDDGTCTCVCPECAPGEDCPPCDCSCDDGVDDGGGVPTPTSTCSCPTCPQGQSCPPCECTGDACSSHADESSCAGDTANACAWINIGAPCMSGEPCISGVCQQMGTGGGGSCGCACPACEPGEECAPCECGSIPPFGGTEGTP